MVWQTTTSKNRAFPLFYIQTAVGSGFTLAAFQLRSFGILPLGASNTITAAVTFVTAPGGDPNDFNSVRLACEYAKEIGHLIHTSFITTAE